MSLVGRIIAGARDLSFGGPLGALLDRAARHLPNWLTYSSSDNATAGDPRRRIAFTIAVIALGAKMAKADGAVTRDEVAAFGEVFQVPPGEEDHVRLVFDLARKSTATFSKRYGFEPREPVTIELYPNHDDFAVRTAGLPGIGLLGVTFGYLVAMDSPSGRATGDFHWGSTLWHEMAHVFTLEATEHRVPRWLSEGISVFEEWRTGPTPGVVVTPDVIKAFNDGKFLKVENLDSGFIRPSYPNQIQVSYTQAGLACLFMEQKFGFDRLVAFLYEFKKDASVASAVSGTTSSPSSCPSFNSSRTGAMRVRSISAMR